MAENFTAEERAAMKERAAEVRKSARRGKRTPAEEEADQLAKIAELPDGDRVLAERIHALVKEHAPELTAKLWYGMPGWARDGKIVCFFQPASKFKSRYGTFGFNDVARLDDGSMWATAFAIVKLSADEEARIADLVKRSVG